MYAGIALVCLALCGSTLALWSDVDAQTIIRDMQFEEREEAIGRRLRVYEAQLGDGQINPFDACTESKQSLVLILTITTETSAAKFRLYMRILFEKDVDQELTVEGKFATPFVTLLESSDVLEAVSNAQSILVVQVEKFVKLGSGLRFKKLLDYHLNLVEFEPLNAGCSCELPKWISNKKVVINVRSNDNMCFVWAVLAGLYKVKNSNPWHTVNKLRPHLKELNLEGIPFPTELKHIRQFERQNSISVSVFGVDEDSECFYPKHLTEKEKPRHVNILYYENHFCLIRDLNRMLFRQSAYKVRKMFCPKCLSKFMNGADLEKHKDLCDSDIWQECEMPKNQLLTFRNYGNVLQEPRVVYADFECILEPAAPATGNGSTSSINHHTPCGAAFVEVKACCKNQPSIIGKCFLRRGHDCVEAFLGALVLLAKDHSAEIGRREKACKRTASDCQDFQAATICHICKGDLAADKVLDHCHFCSKYRGAAHSNCNIANRVRNELTVVFHNLRKYDGHLILQRIGKLASDKNLKFDCIPKGMADYLTFSIKGESWKIRFIDSLQFLPCSLATLVENMRQDQGKFACMKTLFPDHYKLLLRKGVYPYEYMDSFAKFGEQSLPQIQAFSSKLTNSDISNDDYQHASRVFDEMKMRDMGDYHDTYLKADVGLLADVFENFRTFARNHYNLEPVRYITLPSYGWDALFLTTKAELDLLMDEDMYTFVERGMRGGISVITHRYAKANNPAVDGYEPGEPKSFIMYLDANNLYGWTMTQFLPMADYAWSEATLDDILGTHQEADIGYILEVDLEYPPELHDLHNDYPLACEKLAIAESMLSDYCTQHTDGQKRVEKLVPNLRPKSNYVVHYRVLQQFVSLGLTVSKVHRVLQFRQGPWMKDYIMKNTALRAKASNDFEKDLFKLLNNAVFGKSMENVRKYGDVRLISDVLSLQKLVRNPRFDAFQIFHKDLAAVKMTRRKIQLCKPISTGFTVLDLSKMLMTDFHYNVIKARYGDKAQLLFTDTDSLCYLITTEDVYADIKEMEDLFDLSNYPPGDALFSVVNKKVMGKMKDETAGVPIAEFVGLRPKMYSMEYGQSQKSTAKGVVKSVRKTLKHEMYKSILESASQRRDGMPMIRNDGHEVNTIQVNKISLSAFDNKRYILDDGISSYAYGHYMIQ